jgi:hypothetical protein
MAFEEGILFGLRVRMLNRYNGGQSHYLGSGL